MSIQNWLLAISALTLGIGIGMNVSVTAPHLPYMQGFGNMQIRHSLMLLGAPVLFATIYYISEKMIRKGGS